MAECCARVRVTGSNRKMMAVIIRSENILAVFGAFLNEVSIAKASEKAIRLLAIRKNANTIRDAASKKDQTMVHHYASCIYNRGDI